MDLNWDLCIICQQDTQQPLKCPLKSPGTSSDKKDAYRSFLTNVEEFRRIDALPVKLCFGRDETADSFASHSASWHKSCHLKFNNSKLSKAIRKKDDHSDEPEQKRPTKRQALDLCKCLFCGEEGKESDVLHEVSTFDADKNIRTMITELNDAQLLKRIVGGDLMAMESKYHLTCLTKLRNRYRSQTRKTNQTPELTDQRMNESRVFVELTSYIENSVDSGTLLFKLSEIHSMYVNRLGELGINKSVNKTRLKDHLLEHFPEAQDQFDGRNTIIIFKEGMRHMLNEALKNRDFNEDAAILAKAAIIVRKDIMCHQGFKFTGSFPAECQEHSLPSSLKSLVSIILNGPNIKDQDKHESQASLTIGQSIIHNTKKRTSQTSVKSRHTLEREPPLPIYIGLNIHALTRSKKLIQQLYHLGISISYDRVMQIEDWITNSACERFDDDGVVAPACLRRRLFTVGALDNLDHDPSSTTSQTSFHGTGISLFQLPTKSEPGEIRPPLTIPPSRMGKNSLPDNYATVHAVPLKTTAVDVPECEVFPVQSNLEDAVSKEDSWVKYALPLLEKAELTRVDFIAWAAYHSSMQPPVEDLPANCALLPLFHEKSATPAMIKHGMDVVRQTVEYLNPGQVPVTTFDQPLFALAKLVQWKWPDTHGERVHVVMLGGLHTEMTLWNTLGDIMEGSGWTSALTEAEIASAGTAASFLNVAHLARTRHAHQVTLLTLHKLQREAFLLNDGPKDDDTFRIWRNCMKEKSTTFFLLGPDHEV